MAVCVLPGTELSFTDEVKRLCAWPWSKSGIKHKTAIFRKIKKEVQATTTTHWNSPDGQILLLTLLQQDQQATVLQMPVTHQDESTRVPETERAPLLSS